MQKRIISMILAIVLVLSLFPFAAMATDGQSATTKLKLHKWITHTTLVVYVMNI